jgi:hypothetical protein
LAHAHIILLIISCILRMPIHCYSSSTEVGACAYVPIYHQLKLAHKHTFLLIIS